MTFKSIRNISVFLLDYFGIFRNKTVLYLTSCGARILARAGTTDAAEIIIVHSDSEYPKRFFPYVEGALILDIGANIGAFSLYAARILMASKPVIYAIEPHSQNFDLLRQNALAEHTNTIKCCRLAVSDKDGACFLREGSNLDSSYICESGVQGAGESVPALTLETFCGRNGIADIDLLKMDVEGAEYAVFHRSLDFIKRHVKACFIELHYLDEARNIGQFERFIIAQGFIIETKIMGRTLFLRNKEFRKSA